METVLGVSMTPTTVHMVLVEGEHAGGATVDTDKFEVPAAMGGAHPPAPPQVVSAILGTREGTAESGCQLASIGVTWTDPTDAAVLRDLLADQKLEKVMLVSAFLAAAALTQTVGNTTRYAQTALLFVEPSTATMAVVHTADGSVTGVLRRDLPDDDYEAVAALTALAAGAEAMDPRPDGLFVVGSDGVDIAAIRAQLQAASSLIVSTPEEPELALARGAALASANPPLFSSSTAAIAYAQDPGTREVIPNALLLGYAGASAPAGGSGEALAYSAVPEEAGVTTARAFGTGAHPMFDDDDLLSSPRTGSAAAPSEQRATRPFLVAMSVLGLFVGGILALVIALAIAIRPHVDTRPQIGARAVAPAAPAPPPSAPAPKPSAPARSSGSPHFDRWQVLACWFLIAQ
ncbi:hypothetical protein, partial [Mycobacterium sp. E2733]|uniref:DUF7159 family protein n=1 Tax=Mycobacterium sp. E2733 TaxID=1834138 RepID=UPI000AA0656C